MGCIRMVKADIAELFAILPRGAKVSVRATESMR
jgi:lipoprotein-anchoring transpeptidase ErfK/SrfK